MEITSIAICLFAALAGRAAAANDSHVAAMFAMPDCNGFPIEDVSIDVLQDYMSSGNLTSSDLVGCYIQRHLQTDFYIKYVPLVSRISIIAF